MKFVNEKLQEFEEYIYNKNIAIIGLDVSSLPLLDYFRDRGANVTVFDNRVIDDIEKVILDKITERCIKFSFGEHSLINLVGFDMIFKSAMCDPNLPEIRAEGVRGAVITSERELLLELCPGKIIGVAEGTGAYTTANLIYHFLKENRNDCYLCDNSGNGESVFSKIGKMSNDSIVVIEFNNLQLQDIQKSPDIAVLVSIAENYSNGNNEDNRHSFHEYMEHILNMFKYQTEDGVVVLDYDNINNKFLLKDVPGRQKYYSLNSKLDNGVILDKGIIKYCEDGVRRHIVTIDDAISISGEQNFKNICAAVGATIGLIPASIQSRAIVKYKE